MKIQEFRELIKNADRPLLEKAFAECYKQFSKSRKEEIDPLIQDILSGKDSGSAKKVSRFQMVPLVIGSTAFVIPSTFCFYKINSFYYKRVEQRVQEGSGCKKLPRTQGGGERHLSNRKLDAFGQSAQLLRT